MNSRITLSLLVVAVLAGCATAPVPLRGEFSDLVPEQASASRAEGELVRWGGRIVSVTPDPTATCFEVLGRDLSEIARPTRAEDVSNGRFLACRNGFYDPAIFTTERDITVTGRVVGFEVRPIGEYEYRYPKVAADVIHLWPERREIDMHSYPSAFWPMYRPNYWGGYYVPVRVPYKQTAAPPAK